MAILQLDRSAAEVVKTLQKVDNIPKIYLRKDQLEASLQPITSELSSVKSQYKTLEEDLGEFKEQTNTTLATLDGSVKTLTKDVESVESKASSALQRLEKIENDKLPTLSRTMSEVANKVEVIESKMGVTVIKPR